MTYSVEDVQKNLSIVPEDIQKHIELNNLKFGRNGKLSEKSYQVLVESFSNNPAIPGKPIFVLNGNKVRVEAEAIFRNY
jgi:hypothetical protein